MGRSGFEAVALKLVAAIVGALAISFSAIFFGLSEVGAVTGSFFRAFYALPLLGALAWMRRGQATRPISGRWLALGAGIALGLDVMSWHAAIGLIGAGLATLIVNTQVVFVALGAWILEKERPSPQVLLSVPIILIGIALVSGIGQEGAFGDNPLLGAGMALLAALFYATFLLGYRRANTERGLPVGALFEATLGAAAASLIVGLFGPGIDFAVSWPAHGWLLALALGAHVVGWLSVGYALPRLPAAETATIILVQPALTLLWAVLIFSERPSSLQIAGAAIVLAGVGLVVVSRLRQT